MDPPQAKPEGKAKTARAQSFSAASDDSQTAAEYINSQLKLEADAREALPYAFDTCTKELGPLRQALYACLTCNPAAAVCYSCSISCHGDHELADLHSKRNFVCDCGTTRFPPTNPCTLRLDPKTNTKGVHSETPAASNKYNDNFMNRFCGCKCDYDAETQKGAMFQCLGLEGGCGEDWWHPWCVMGLGPAWVDEQRGKDKSSGEEKGPMEESGQDDDDDDDTFIPPGFPKEEEFEGFICYICVEANPWIKRYAGTAGFLPPVPFKRSNAPSPESMLVAADTQQPREAESKSKKRRASESSEDIAAKRLKGDEDIAEPQAESKQETPNCRYEKLPTPPADRVSIFLKPDFREHFCRCPDCFPHLSHQPYLLEEEESYEPPLSESGDEGGGSTAGSGSLLDRGERALSNLDRVKAIEGVMAYNHLKEKLVPFFKEFADSGKAISAEDITGYFAKLRGDEQAIKDAGAAAAGSNDNRKEQGGY